MYANSKLNSSKPKIIYNHQPVKLSPNHDKGNHSNSFNVKQLQQPQYRSERVSPRS